MFYYLVTFDYHTIYRCTNLKEQNSLIDMIDNYAPEIEDQRADFFFNKKCMFYLKKKMLLQLLFLFSRD